MTLAAIVLLITLLVLITQFSRNYRRSLRRQVAQAGGVATGTAVMPAKAGINRLGWGKQNPDHGPPSASHRKNCKIGPMSKSALATSLDTLQSHLDPLLQQAGFRKRGRTYNRITADGLTHVIGFQMGRFDPPGTTHIPGLRNNLYGRFTVNLGVCVPEVARNHIGGKLGSVVHDYNCSIRTRLGRTDDTEFWWQISTSEPLVSEFQDRLQSEALPFFKRFENRDQILAEFRTATNNTELMVVPRIVCAVIFLNRGDRKAARELLAAQARDHTRNPGHRAYVIDLAKRLGVEIEA